MFLEKKKGILSLALVGTIAFTSTFDVLAANPQSEAQSITINHETQMSPLAETWQELPEMASVAVDTQEWEGKALANTDSKLKIYKEASGDSKAIANMFKNTIVTVKEQGETWSKISSGNITGYVKTENLLFGSAAVERAEVTCASGTRNAEKITTVSASTSDEKLLAAIIYCEAGNQSHTGKVAVGAVILNRVKSSRFPNSIKSVVYQKGQFTPAMTGKLNRVLASGSIPSSCYQAARDALNGSNPIGNALYFNTHSGSFKLGDHYFS